MFDIGWQELFIIAVLAIIVVGPKDLPQALRMVTKWLKKARSMAREFQSGIDDMVREAELDDVKRQIEGVADYDISKEIQDTLDPKGAIADDIESLGDEFSRESILEGESRAPDAEDAAGDGAGPEAAAPRNRRRSPSSRRAIPRSRRAIPRSRRAIPRSRRAIPRSRRA
ncbi:MAG: twin-arginine translocase subunit TatB, partial [Proteobacteria bacterium]|nr:twin-arginine translocase subunit TatB [Pseudomonadota bacterium]